jgi:chromosome segregation ATPase
MTPEERWIKIENAIQALVGSQAQHQAEIAESRGQIAETNKQIAENRRQIAETNKQIARIGERMDKKASQIDEQIEKNAAAIRDLIVVSRTVIDAQQESDKRMARLHSEIKAELEQLIKAVNAFLKGFQKPNGNQ